MISKDKRGKGEYNRTYKENNREKILFLQAKYRAKTKEIPFDIDVSDIIIPEICPILKIELKKIKMLRNPVSPSQRLSRR